MNLGDGGAATRRPGAGGVPGAAGASGVALLPVSRPEGQGRTRSSPPELFCGWIQPRSGGGSPGLHLPKK